VPVTERAPRGTHQIERIGLRRTIGQKVGPGATRGSKPATVSLYLFRRAAKRRRMA
jgi:hypothetical protein